MCPKRGRPPHTRVDQLLQAWFPALVLLNLGLDIGDLHMESVRCCNSSGGGIEAYGLRRLGLDDEFLLLEILLPVALALK